MKYPLLIVAVLLALGCTHGPGPGGPAQHDGLVPLDPETAHIGEGIKQMRLGPRLFVDGAVVRVAMATRHEMVNQDGPERLSVIVELADGRKTPLALARGWDYQGLTPTARGRAVFEAALEPPLRPRAVVVNYEGQTARFTAR